MSKKHFCIVLDDFLPESTKSGSKMMQELTLTLIKKGHKVTVLTHGKAIGEINFNGAEVLTFKTGKIKNTHKVLRLINEIKMPRQAYIQHRKKLNNLDIDGLIYYSPSIFFHPLVNSLKKKWNCKSYLVLRDFFPQWAIDTEILKPNSLSTKFLEHNELKTYRAADKIGIQTPNNEIFFKKRFGDQFTTEVLYNWTECASGPKAESSTYNLRKKESIDQNDIVFFYGGNLGIAQNIPRLLELTKSVKHISNLKFFFLGNGDYQKTTKEFCEQSSNCIYTNPVSQSEYRKILDEVDFGLISLDSRNTTHNVPGKILNYLSKDLPLAGLVNPGNDLLEIVNNKCGLLIDTFEEKYFVEMIQKSIQNKSLFKESCSNILNKYFDVNLASNQIISFFN